MTPRSVSLILTAAGFAAGLGTGLWVGINKATPPPPPAWLFTEFRNISTPGTTLKALVQSRPELWSEIRAELKTLEPQIEEYRRHLEAIDGEFRSGLEAILGDAQKARLAEALKRHELPRMALPKAAPAPAPAAAAPKPAEPAKAGPERAPRIPYDSMDGTVTSMVFLPYTLERFSQVLGLSEDQEAALQKLLAKRRDAFIQLSDATPPPSLQLRRIADIIRRSAATPAPAAPKAP